MHKLKIIIAGALSGYVLAGVYALAQTFSRLLDGLPSAGKLCPAAKLDLAREAFAYAGLAVLCVMLFLDRPRRPRKGR